jgi:protein arginine kinase activator
MKCQECGQPATVHLTDIVNKQKHETHLCDECAKKHGLFAGGSGQLNLQALVQLTVGQPAAADPGALTCPRCGLKYAAFRADGRLGCAHEYDAFRAALEPLLERIHHATRHVGKVPRAAWRRTQLADLHEQLRAAVAAENYEEAARLRDRLRQKEGADEPR